MNEKELHEHTKLQEELGLDKEHVIIDREAFDRVSWLYLSKGQSTWDYLAAPAYKVLSAGDVA